MKTKTIVFDLDDTIIKEIEYLKSAFTEIANFIDKTNSTLFIQMIDWYHNKENVFQKLIEVYPAIKIDDLKKLYRHHFPNFNSNSTEKQFLISLKKDGYKLGLITDGYSITQRNKIKALDIEKLFDLIIISEEFGSEKPNPNNYEAFHQFDTDEYYYIGDNLKKDFVTPNTLGWTTICLIDDGNNIHKQDFDKDELYLPHKKVNAIFDIKFHNE